MSSPISASIACAHPITLSHGRNALVWDTEGKQYIDFVGGIGVLNLGHCHPQVVSAITEQAQKLTHYCFNAVPHAPYRQLMAALADYLPLDYPLAGMLTNSGAEAAENALKMVRAATGRSAVIAFDGGFHGRTLATISLNGKVAPYKQKVGLLPGPVFHVPYPSADTGVSAEEGIKAIERLFSVEIDSSEVACVIFEAVQGEGGFLAMDPAFAKALRALCDKHGILLVADEIQSGFGRSGQAFAFSRLGIQPDLVLLGKSIAGGMPLGAVIGRESIVGALPKGGLGGTYSGNPIACAAALASLSLLSEDNILAWGKAQCQALESRYQSWQEKRLSPYLGRLTGVGSMRGIELLDGKGGAGSQQLSEVLQAARSKGLLLMPSGKQRNIIRLLAPLTIEAEIYQQGLDILELCLAEIA